ncbi:MAG: hypothetical protein HXY46_04510 [Syntrophaceae bacterium]|nr:hypothetical protein [Syntrophaceae bacterium]
MVRTFLAIVGLLILTSTLVMANGEHPKSPGEETDAKAFKILKEKSIDPKTGLPKTLDPDLFKSRTRRAYQIAKEIPRVLAQMPCFCECEAFGHENLLDCFIDNHAAG